ncbi:MAG: RNA polymerase sigma-70 factor [Bacteroides sp.]|jgi:RNA polymerase sigma-70 factor (ECF subfamily)|nr:RNA polymerase sigma-70 factor [Bacteroides sp.]MCI1682434.1 RNA polymerase sigma-70 factor [Bacteroides sp.]
MSNLNDPHTISSFSRFFQENQKEFLSFTYSYIKNWTEAEDILMESAVALWECRERWEKGKDLRPLLLTIIKNKALNFLEHTQARMRIEEDLNNHQKRELNLRIATLRDCDPNKIFSAEIQDLVYKALDKMPEQSKKVFILSRFNNLPNNKIAEQLNISLKTVEFHITKALRILRIELKDYLISILF